MPSPKCLHKGSQITNPVFLFLLWPRLFSLTRPKGGGRMPPEYTPDINMRVYSFILDVDVATVYCESIYKRNRNLYFPVEFPNLCIRRLRLFLYLAGYTNYLVQ